MKTKLHCLFIALALLAGINQTVAQGTAFTYQGQLFAGTNPASGTYNLTFSLFNVNSGGSAVAGPFTNNGVIVTNGLFTVLINFGSGVFIGQTNWLQIGVATNGVNTFTTLTPRQQLTPTPYAIYAESANAVGISGTLPAASFSGTYGNAVTLNNAGNSFSGNGAGLTSVNATTLNGLNAANFWQTTGNGGTSTGVNYVGTTDNQPLEFHVNGQRAFRLEPTTNSPNVIGGFSANIVSAGVTGGTIAGGGAVGAINSIEGGHYPTISGGYANDMQGFSDGAVIGGGASNIVDSVGCTIAGGVNNSLQGSGPYSTIGGGFGNAQISDGVTGFGSTISGGENNGIHGSANSTISGGEKNRITESGDSAIGGGGGNTMNLMEDCTIAGGNGNSMFSSGTGNTIGGGTNNTIDSVNSATICGGVNNSIQLDAHGSAILGGVGNIIGFNSDSSTISGGTINIIQSGSSGVSIGGGISNSIASGSSSATIAGGQSNFVFAPYGMIPGGAYNTAGNFAFAAGQRAVANAKGAFVWSDGSATTTSTAVDQFMVRASGGVIIYSSSGNTAGVSLAAGSGTWASLSDRNAKDDFGSVIPEQVLAKVAELPITKWSYKTERGVRHVGPMAQDFYAAFGVGEDNKHITTVDEEGVALAAIQGLNQKLEQQLNRQNAENAKLKQQNDSLAERLNELEATVKRLAAQK